MMSIGMHCRLLGRPGRIAALQRFLDHIARARPRLGLPPHRHRAPLEAGRTPSTPRADHGPRPSNRLNAATPAEAAALLDGLYEHSPWIAERGAGAAALPLAGAPEARAGAASCASAGASEQLALIRAHPELAGKAMVSKTLTGRIDQRAGQGRPDRLHARGVRDASSSSTPTTTRSSASPSSWRCAGRAAPGLHARSRSSTPSSAAWTTTPTSSWPRRCATSTASPRSA